ncbi:MAG TPA: ribosome small subunit-dependent GTPase A [Clostridiaceae bacterium]
MQGVIIKGIGGFYYVQCGDIVYECKAIGRFRFDEISPLVGDKVEITTDKDKGIMEKIYTRSNELLRPSVANVTQAFVIFTIKNPDLNYELINKFLLLSEYNGLKIYICINKMDLLNEDDKKAFEDYFIGTSYNIHFINSKEGIGIDDLKGILSDNITVFCGPSGVGKSTLLNTLAGEEKMFTGEISGKNNRGKHTTRHSELIKVDKGYIIDTPGFSSLELDFFIKEEVQNLFPEFEVYKDNCRFKSCMHLKEPSCAVKEAVELEKISKYRYDFYVKTVESLNKPTYGGKKKK